MQQDTGDGKAGYSTLQMTFVPRAGSNTRPAIFPADRANRTVPLNPLPPVDIGTNEVFVRGELPALSDVCHARLSRWKTVTAAEANAKMIRLAPDDKIDAIFDGKPGSAPANRLLTVLEVCRELAPEPIRHRLGSATSIDDKGACR